MKKHHNGKGKNRLEQLEITRPKKSEKVKKMLEKTDLRRELKAMDKKQVIEYAAEHEIPIDPDKNKAQIIKEILAFMFPPSNSEPNSEPAYPTGDPSSHWLKDELIAYCADNDIVCDESWSEEDILDAIEAA